jgi:hypothetical protein
MAGVGGSFDLSASAAVPAPPNERDRSIASMSLVAGAGTAAAGALTAAADEAGAAGAGTGARGAATGAAGAGAGVAGGGADEIFLTLDAQVSALANRGVDLRGGVLIQTIKITSAATAPPTASRSQLARESPQRGGGAAAGLPRARRTSSCRRARTSGDSSKGAPASSRRFLAQARSRSSIFWFGSGDGIKD